MNSGRKKIPNELKTLRGTDQPCRMAGSDIPAPTSIVAIPSSGLKGTAKKVFEVVAAELINNRLLDIVGVDLIVAYAREMGLYHDTMRELEKEGYTIEIETKFGSTTLANPKRKVAESALANAKVLAVEYGFTPASRSCVAALLANNTPKDEFAEFEELK